MSPNSSTHTPEGTATQNIDFLRAGVIAGFSIHTCFIVIIIFLLILIMKRLHMIPCCEFARLVPDVLSRKKSRGENLSLSRPVQRQHPDQVHGHPGPENHSTPHDDKAYQNENQRLELKTVGDESIYGNCPGGGFLKGNPLQPGSRSPSGQISATPSADAVDHQEVGGGLYYTNLNYVSQPVSAESKNLSPTYFILEYETAASGERTNAQSAALEKKEQNEGRAKQRKKKQPKVKKSGALQPELEAEYVNSSNAAMALPGGRAEQMKSQKYQRILFKDKERFVIDVGKGEQGLPSDLYSRIHGSAQQQTQRNGTGLDLETEAL